MTGSLQGRFQPLPGKNQGFLGDGIVDVVDKEREYRPKTLALIARREFVAQAGFGNDLLDGNSGRNRVLVGGTSDCRAQPGNCRC